MWSCFLEDGQKTTGSSDSHDVSVHCAMPGSPARIHDFGNDFRAAVVREKIDLHAPTQVQNSTRTRRLAAIVQLQDVL